MSGLLRGCFGIVSDKRIDAEIDGRLGKNDLGRYAYEKKMPDWLYRLLENEEKQHIEDAPPRITDILRKLLEQDRDVETAYLCPSAVRYVGKIKVQGKDEGNSFCGYHNIQMLFSYIYAADAEGFGNLAGDVPTIWRIQDMIEEAWDRGFNESGRAQTGGIRGTRKHIGTPEVQALFRSLDIPCKAGRFQDITRGTKAYEQLLDSVEEYFSPRIAVPKPPTSPKVQVTALPPIYLQRPHHSMTIVGMEKRKNGSRNLLVFDPAYFPSREMLRIVSEDRDFKYSDSLVKPYRRGKNYLGNFNAFETLRLAPEA